MKDWRDKEDDDLTGEDIDAMLQAGTPVRTSGPDLGWPEIDAGKAAIAEWEKVHGAITPAEKVAAERELEDTILSCCVGKHRYDRSCVAKPMRFSRRLLKAVTNKP